MEYIKHDFLIPFEDSIDSQVESAFNSLHYQETVTQQNVFHPGCFPIFCDYRELERHEGPEGQWDWQEWSERQVFVKVEADLDGTAVGPTSFNEEG
jgi:hypothetical protein